MIINYDREATPRHRPRHHHLSIDPNSSSLASNHDQDSTVERWLDHHPSHANRYSDAHQPIRRGEDGRPLYRRERRAHSHSPRRSRREGTHHRSHRSRARNHDRSPFRAGRSSTYRDPGDALMRRESPGPVIRRSDRHSPERRYASPTIDDNRAGSWTCRTYRITSESPSPPAGGSSSLQNSIRATICHRSPRPPGLWNEYVSYERPAEGETYETVIRGPILTEQEPSRMTSEFGYCRPCSPHRDQNRGIGGYRYSMEDHPSRDLNPDYLPRCRRDSW